VALGPEGPQKVTLVARDAAENERAVEWNVVRDLTPPAVEIASPLENAVLGTQPVPVTAIVHDATAVTVKVNGIAAGQTQDSWTVPVPVPVEGPQTFTVVAVDAAGNVASAARNMVVDLNAPVVTIEAPEAATLTTAESITVRGRVSDVTATAAKIGTLTVLLSAGTFSADVSLAKATTTFTSRRWTRSNVKGRRRRRHARFDRAVDRHRRTDIDRAAEGARPLHRRRQPGTRTGRRQRQRRAGGTFTSPSFGLDLVVPQTLAVGALRR
jgi:hypothetical protein